MITTRWKRVLAVVGVVAACGGAAAAVAFVAAGSGGPGRFVSRPGLDPPKLRVAHSGPAAGDGLVFVAPKPRELGEDGMQKGPMIVNNAGAVVWFHPLRRREAEADDFRVQRYRGQQVLTWWQGRITPSGYGVGSYVIMNDRYQRIARVAPRGYPGADLHELVITPRDTALLLIYDPVRRGDPDTGASRRVMDTVIQEVDIPSGRVRFEWHALGHIGLGESYGDFLHGDGVFDYLHPNSIALTPDGNLLLSGRHTSAVYKIDRGSGQIMWRLGGKRSDYALDRGARFAYQHDARMPRPGTVTVFDNGAYPAASPHRQSRGTVLQLNGNAGTASLARAYAHHPGLLADSQGSMQTLPGGRVFVGWGSRPAYTEYTPAGQMIYDAGFPPGVVSYRAFRLPWHARPASKPAITTRPAAGGRATVWASWNGATDIATWQVPAGPTPAKLHPVAAAPKTGFETALTVPTDAGYVAVRARDTSGRVLGTSPARSLQDAVLGHHRLGVGILGR